MTGGDRHYILHFQSPRRLRARHFNPRKPLELPLPRTARFSPSSSSPPSSPPPLPSPTDMLGTSYASRKTSITQLLNPLLPPSGPDHKSHPSGLPGFSSPANAPAQHYQPLQQTAAFQSQQTPQSHFGLRAANWDTTVDFNRRQGDEDGSTLSPQAAVDF